MFTNILLKGALEKLPKNFLGKSIGPAKTIDSILENTNRRINEYETELAKFSDISDEYRESRSFQKGIRVKELDTSFKVLGIFAGVVGSYLFLEYLL